MDWLIVAAMRHWINSHANVLTRQCPIWRLENNVRERFFFVRINRLVSTVSTIGDQKSNPAERRNRFWSRFCRLLRSSCDKEKMIDQYKCTSFPNFLQLFNCCPLITWATMPTQSNVVDGQTTETTLAFNNKHLIGSIADQWYLERYLLIKNFLSSLFFW